MSVAEATSLPAYIKVLIVQEVRKGTGRNSGKPYEMQEIDCMTLDQDGVEMQVGVMQVPAPLLGKITRGTYRPVYGMRVDFASRGIKPAIIDLEPVVSAPVPGRPAVAKPAAAAADAAPKA